LENAARKSNLSRLLPLRIAAVLAIAVNFFWFTAGIFGSHFAPDEMMNMGWAWEAGIAKILANLAQFYTTFYRPTGALYYWTLHRLFGLNPVPYRVIDLAVLAFHVWLAYRLASVLSRSRPVAWLAAFLFSYHEKIMIWVAYNGAWVYDRLCFTFSISALLVYVRARSRGGEISLRRGAAILVLYVLALGSKEMAVAVPVLLIAYECVYAFRTWRQNRNAWLLITLLCVMTALYAYGKTHGPDSLINNPQYRPVLNAATYLRSQARHMQDYFFLNHAFSPAIAAFILLAMAAAAFAFRSRPLIYAIAFLIFSPLPIAFINRSGGSLYIPLFGWCLFAAQALAEISALSAGFCRMPRVRAPLFACLAAALSVFVLRSNVYYQSFAKQPMLHNGDVTWRMIEDLNRIHPKISPNGKVLIERNPFEGYNMVFITQLWANVKPIDVWIAGKNVAPDIVPPGTSVVLTLDSTGHLVQVPPPPQ